MFCAVPQVAEMKKGRLGYSIGAANSSAEVQLSEALHAAAFLDSNPLGTPYMTSNAQSVSPDALAAHASATFSAGNMVLSAAGVADHAAFVAAAEASFGGAADGAASAPSPYGGGEVRVKTSGGQSYVALAFQVCIYYIQYIYIYLCVCVCVCMYVCVCVFCVCVFCVCVISYL
jgi:predicted Zn-dependent peptidase